MNAYGKVRILGAVFIIIYFFALGLTGGIAAWFESNFGEAGFVVWMVILALLLAYPWHFVGRAWMRR